ncbi:MAG: ACP S-malonyltransferase [Coriobacteriia bacterium]
MGPRVALVFPGQGAQRPGMLDSVPETEDMDRLLDAAEALSGLPLRSVAASGSDGDLTDTRIAQPLLYLTDWAWGRALLDSGVTPCFVAGHSLGEIVALSIVGVFSVEAGLDLVVQRSRLMSEAALTSPGTMAAVLGLGRDAVVTAIQGLEDVYVANDNSPVQTVISGSVEGVARAGDTLTAAGARRVVPLRVGGAFHSPFMASAAAAFADLLGGADFADARIPVVPNSNPVPATSGAVLRERLARQMVEPVRWTETVAMLSDSGVDVVVECGPSAVLKGLARGTEVPLFLSVEADGVGPVLEEVGLGV